MASAALANATRHTPVSPGSRHVRLGTWRYQLLLLWRWADRICSLHLPLAPQADGSTRAFPKTKEAYVNWGDLDELDGSRGSRFVKPLEPYTEQLTTKK